MPASDQELRIYIAGPISSDPEGWAAAGALLFHELMDYGFVPFLPHVGVWIARFSGRDQAYERWMDWCFAWLAQCEILYRMPSESPGADREVAWAKEHGIPVAENLAELIMVRTNVLRQRNKKF